MKRIRRSRKKETDEELNGQQLPDGDSEAEAVYKEVRDSKLVEGRNLKLWNTIYELAEEIEAMEPWAGYQMFMPIMLELRIHGEKMVAASRA